MNRPIRQTGALVLAILIVRASAAAGGISAYAWVDSTRFLVGDWITVHVDVRHPKGVSLRPVLGDTLGSFHVIHTLTPAQTTDTSEVGGMVIAKFEAGSTPIPPLTFFYVLAGDTTPRTVATRPIPVTVSEVAVDTTKDIRDLKPPLSIPLTIAEILLFALAVLALGGLVYGGYRLWKRRKTKRPGGEYVPPARPAHVIALEQLAILREKKLWQQGMIKEYYSEVTDILRRYIENRYRQPALEETTDEIMAGLKRLRFTDDLMGAMERILRRADLVKFAKLHPAPQEHEEMMTIVTEVVDKTKIVAMTPVAAPDAKVQAHAG